jgi:hypothetical protein
MTFRLISDKLLEVILLLLALYVIQMVLSLAMPFFPIEDLRMLFIINVNIIGNAAFALLIYWQARKLGAAAISIVILTIFLPVFGVIFYLLMYLQNTQGNDKQEL